MIKNVNEGPFLKVMPIISEIKLYCWINRLVTFLPVHTHALKIFNSKHLVQI